MDQIGQTREVRCEASQVRPELKRENFEWNIGNQYKIIKIGISIITSLKKITKNRIDREKKNDWNLA